MTPADSQAPAQRRRLLLGGLVQGVGLRPYVCRLAQELGLAGWVGNTAEGVAIEVEGGPAALAQFEQRLRLAPPPARVEQCLSTPLPASGADSGFRVADSSAGGHAQPCASPDLAPCPACLEELFDPGARRYRYPFISCSHCGPRYSILDALPFDRERTAMAGFPLCPSCLAEYRDPTDRRFHAQTMACPVCGPRLALWDANRRPLAEADAALRLAVAALRQGQIVAVKGVGGFQLLADAGQPAAVAELRRRKQRPDKPFALLADLAMAQRLCRLSPEETALLQEPAAPIVLLERHDTATGLAPAVAPGLPWLGLMLPASPLHHVLLADCGRPLVATSGNRSSEPICIDENDALQRLRGITDVFLVHDRPIRRPLDDSVVRHAAGRPLALRRARGYAPAPIELPANVAPLLAVGGHLKNTVAISLGRQAVLSQHLGDLDDALTQQQCQATLEELPRLFGVAPSALACDDHPDYASRRLAESRGLPPHPVPHHYAHALACLAEHRLQPPVLAIAWDGIGLGDDGGLWGGEFLRIEAGGYRRYASLLPLRLPGGEKAVKEPRRVALAAVHAAAADWQAVPAAVTAAFSGNEQATLQTMLERGLNTPECSSAGRLFDAVAALLGLCQVNAFEGQAAMLLEAAASRVVGEIPLGTSAPAWGLQEDPHGLLRCDWRPWLQALLNALGEDCRVRTAHHSSEAGAQCAPYPEREASAALTAQWAYAFHLALAETALAVAQREGLETVVLCGGCFQNRLLLELCATRLRQAGFTVHWPQNVPPNDGGLALGQLLAAARWP